MPKAAHHPFREGGRFLNGIGHAATAPNRLNALATQLVVHQQVQRQILPGLGMAPYPRNDRFQCTSFEHHRIPSAADPEMHTQHDKKEDSKSRNGVAY